MQAFINTKSKMKNGLFLFLCFAFVFLLISCGTDAESAKAAEQKPKPEFYPLEDYVGKFELIELDTTDYLTPDYRYTEFYIEDDSLYANPNDDIPVVTYPEKNEVFAIPYYKTKIKFHRNDAGKVDRASKYIGHRKFESVKVE